MEADLRLFFCNIFKLFKGQIFVLAGYGFPLVPLETEGSLPFRWKYCVCIYTGMQSGIFVWQFHSKWWYWIYNLFGLPAVFFSVLLFCYAVCDFQKLLQAEYLPKKEHAVSCLRQDNHREEYPLISLQCLRGLGIYSSISNLMRYSSSTRQTQSR